MYWRQMILLSLFFVPLVAQVGAFFPVWSLPPQAEKNIQLYVGITDHKGEPPVDIRPDEIEVYEDDVRQKITSASNETGPLSIGILIDNSSSQQKHFSAVLSAVQSFIESSAEASEFFLVTFGSEIKTVSDFADRQTTLSRLTNPAPEKRSKIYDAIHYGLAKVQQGKFTRRALLLITDGQDGGSSISYRELFRELKRSDVQIYCLGVGNTNSDGGEGPGNFQIGHLLLEELTATTGGTVYTKDKPEQLIAGARLIASQMRHQYRIVYQRTTSSGKEHWQKVKVRINSSRPHGKVKVHAREGFYTN